MQNNQLTKTEMFDIRQVILSLNDQYVNNKIEGKLIIEDFWPKLGKVILELTNNRHYRSIIGGVNADILDRNIIKITNKIKQHKEAKAIDDQTKSNISYNEAELYIGEILRTLDDIFVNIENV